MSFRVVRHRRVHIYDSHSHASFIMNLVKSSVSIVMYRCDDEQCPWCKLEVIRTRPKWVMTVTTQLMNGRVIWRNNYFHWETERLSNWHYQWFQTGDLIWKDFYKQWIRLISFRSWRWVEAVGSVVVGAFSWELFRHSVWSPGHGNCAVAWAKIHMLHLCETWR